MCLYIYIYIYIKENENRESGTANWFLVPYLNNRLGYFKSVNWQQGILNRELLACSIFFIYNTEVSKVQIGNKDPVHGSFLTILGFVLI